MAKVVSVNVGLPREIQWNGRTVRTGIWKSPVAGKVRVGRLNLEGDAQADLAAHGGEQRAILVFQVQSYRYFEQLLGREPLPPGSFGENLTVDGLSDEEVCIGDRYRVGDAVVEVTQPRVTCYRVGVRLNAPELPALLVKHRRPGFYLRVIEPGEIAAGDPIDQVAAGPERISVAEIDQLLYSSKHPRSLVERALRIPALSPGWGASMQALLRQVSEGGAGNAGLTAEAPALAWRGLRALRISGAAQVGADIRALELASPDGTPLPATRPGQYVLVRVRPSGGGPEATRSYSLCGPPLAPRWRIAVKDEGGRASGYLNHVARVGDLLEVGAPRGDFALPPGNGPVAFISGGVGVTPVLAMLYAAAAQGRPVWWVHTARDEAHLGFTAEIAHLLPSSGGHRLVALSRGATEPAPGGAFDRVGRLDAAALAALNLPAGVDVCLCGPTAFMSAMIAALETAGVARDHIHAETFGPAVAPGAAGILVAPHAPAGPTGRGPMVNFVKSGLSVRWDDRFGGLLELAEACDVPVRWSCRTGVCHTCECGLIDGAVNYSPEPLDPPAEGLVLLCCARPASAVTVDA